MLRARWKQILFGAAFQYVHAMSTQLAHRMHRPQPQLLHDVGFELLPELGLQRAWMSETVFWIMFIPFILWSFSPFVTYKKKFYTAVLYARLLMVLVICQSLRIIFFTVTQLPAPNYHCHLGEPTAVREMPKHWWGHVVVDLGRQATHGCGDLIFSSHTTFILVGVLTFTEYGNTLLIKIAAWIGVAFLSLCIIASHKHYSVDVVVAWYAVPLVFYTMHRRWTTVRPAHEVWPHRPLAGETSGSADLSGPGYDVVMNGDDGDDDNECYYDTAITNGNGTTNGGYIEMKGISSADYGLAETNEIGGDDVDSHGISPLAGVINNNNVNNNNHSRHCSVPMMEDRRAAASVIGDTKPLLPVITMHSRSTSRATLDGVLNPLTAVVGGVGGASSHVRSGSKTGLMMMMSGHSRNSSKSGVTGNASGNGNGGGGSPTTMMAVDDDSGVNNRNNGGTSSSNRVVAGSGVRRVRSLAIVNQEAAVAAVAERGELSGGLVVTQPNGGGGGGGVNRDTEVCSIM